VQKSAGPQTHINLHLDRQNEVSMQSGRISPQPLARGVSSGPPKIALHPLESTQPDPLKLKALTAKRIKTDIAKPDHLDPRYSAVKRVQTID
jgi:hypothetical protein